MHRVLLRRSARLALRASTTWSRSTTTLWKSGTTGGELLLTKYQQPLIPITLNRLFSSGPAPGETILDATPAPEAEKEEAPKFVDTESVRGPTETCTFQAETRQLLDIVTNSLYTDKEVFVRELISNASDALEKRRHFSVDGRAVAGDGDGGSIKLYTRQTEDGRHQLIIQDTGIGMTRDELVTNIGTIARSGSKAFLSEIQAAASDESVPRTDIRDRIIGQFGVGFYSAFMVADRLTVYTRSANADGDSTGYCWSSDGTGSYTLQEADGVEIGTKVVMDLKESCSEYSNAVNIEGIIKKYSNFVSFPILLNGERVNTVEALWTMSRNSVTDEQHKNFYQFVANAFDEPMMKLHFQADTPLSIQSLFYVPQHHMEKYGMGRMDPGVNLMSRKVLIQSKSKLILPDFLRFLKGVVDSEDIPLNISREHMQDSRLIQRLNTVLTKRILRWFRDEARTNNEQYLNFFKEFGKFLKEGICTEHQFKDDIAPLLRFESSTVAPASDLTSLDEYIKRVTSEDAEKDDAEKAPIYYLSAPSRQLAEQSPYFEAFKKHDKEVLFVYTPLDDFVMSNLSTYKGHKLTTIESSSAAFSELNDEKKADDAAESSKPSDSGPVTRMTEEQVAAFTTWFQGVLEDKVSKVEATNRLVDSPALIVDHGENAAMRRMIRMIEQDTYSNMLPKQQLLINPKHDIIVGLDSMRQSTPDVAAKVAEQLYDNALIAAGLVDDCRPMLQRMNDILKFAVKTPSATSQSANSESQS